MAWYRHTGASYRPPERVLEVVGLPFKGPSNRCHGRACDEGVHEGWYVIIGCLFIYFSDFFCQKHLFVLRPTIFTAPGISKAHQKEIWPGRWIAEDCWPSPNVHQHEFFLQTDRGLAVASDRDEKIIEKEPTESIVPVKSSYLSGAWGGFLFANGLEDLPVEQGIEDVLAECWETKTLKEPVSVVGFPEVYLQISCDRPSALVAARLCDVFPNGESVLITRGRSTKRTNHLVFLILSYFQSFTVCFGRLKFS